MAPAVLVDVLLCLRARDARCTRHVPSPVDQEDLAVRADVRDSLDLVVHGQGSAHVRDLADLVLVARHLVVCCPGRGVRLLPDGRLEGLRHAAVAVSVTRRRRKAR